MRRGTEERTQRTEGKNGIITRGLEGEEHLNYFMERSLLIFYGEEERKGKERARRKEGKDNRGGTEIVRKGPEGREERNEIREEITQRTEEEEGK
jgi:hypothetical protein